MVSACMMVDNRCAINKVICSFLSEIERMVSVISSSVIESNAEVASSKSKTLGFLNKARAIEIRCFSPPESFSPPSPITVRIPLSVLSSKL